MGFTRRKFSRYYSSIRGVSSFILKMKAYPKIPYTLFEISGMKFILCSSTWVELEKLNHCKKEIVFLFYPWADFQQHFLVNLLLRIFFWVPAGIGLESPAFRPDKHKPGFHRLNMIKWKYAYLNIIHTKAEPPSSQKIELSHLATKGPNFQFKYKLFLNHFKYFVWKGVRSA